MVGLPRCRCAIVPAAVVVQRRLVWYLCATLLTIFALSPCTALAHHQPTVGDDSILTVGRVSGSPRRHFAALEALAMYLAPRLADHGVTSFDVVLANDNEQMIDLLNVGTVDLVMETAFSALEFESRAGARPFLRQWKGGVASYRALFVSRVDSGIESLGDLTGRIVAFEDRGSTSGFFVPWATAVRYGLKVIPDDGSPAADAVRYVFAGNEENVLAWVVRGRAAAGALSSRDWNDPKRTPPGLKTRLRAFYESPPIIRSLLLVRDGMPAALQDRLARILVSMHEDPEGRPVLEKFFETSRFDRLEGDARAELEFARGLYTEFGGTLMSRQP